MGEPTEVMYLDPTKKQDVTKSQGAFALEYEPTLVSCFFYSGTQGIVILPRPFVGEKDTL